MKGETIASACLSADITGSGHKTMNASCLISEGALPHSVLSARNVVCGDFVCLFVTVD